MEPRTAFLLSQGWTMLTSEDEGGLWRSPQGGFVRAKEAEQVALAAMTSGLAYWFANAGESKDSLTSVGYAMVKASIAHVVMSETQVMYGDPAFQKRMAAFFVGSLTEDMMRSLRDVLRAILAIEDKPPVDKH